MFRYRAMIEIEVVIHFLNIKTPNDDLPGGRPDADIYWGYFFIPKNCIFQ